jgi:carbonic anhydrase
MSSIRRLWLSAVTVAVVFFAVNAFALDADEALAVLKAGNARFVAMKMQYPDINTKRMVDTAANGQKPFAIVLACSDSRVPVETIFDRGIGDIFVVRVAGNVAVDPSVIGSIEYAVGHLGSPLLVIMGHTDCGAVKAAVSGAPMEGDIHVIQKTIEIAVEKVKKDRPSLTGNDLTPAVVKENVIQAMEDILTKSEEIGDMVKEGKLKIVPAVYDLKTGVVEWL